MKQFLGITFSLCLTIAIAGCATQRLGQYASFATAGSLYVANFHQVTAQAGSAMIAVDSVVMIAAHRNIASDLPKNPAKYSAQVSLHDELLEKHLAVLQLIDAHATLLGSYFDAVSKLADDKSASGTTSAATDLLKSIESLNPAVAKATFLGKSVQDYVTIGTPFIVAHFQVKALDEQLQRAAPTIDTALSLQEAAVGAIAEEIKVSLTDTLASKEETDVIQPYLKTSDLPANWNTNREAYLRATVTLKNVDSAQAAMKQLHIAFKQLVENQTATVNLQNLISAVSQMSNYASAAESTLKTGTPSKVATP